MKDKASVAVHFSRWEDGAFGCCTKCLHVILACADTCRMWPVAKSALCVCAWSLRVQLTAPPHPDMHKQCHIVCSRARLGLCVRLPSDHKEGDRACLCVCVCVCLFYILDVTIVCGEILSIKLMHPWRFWSQREFRVRGHTNRCGRAGTQRLLCAEPEGAHLFRCSVMFVK